MLKFFIGLLWLAASVYLGYRLTEYSFTVVREPRAGVVEKSSLNKILNLAPKAIIEKLPAQGESPEDWYASLNSEEQLCLQKSVSENTLQAALAGQEITPSPLELIAISACLK